LGIAFHYVSGDGMKHPTAIRFLRLTDLRNRRGQSTSSIYRDIRNGLFPPPVKLGENTSAWPEHEADAIARAQIAGADSARIRTLVSELVAARKLGA
jgi:prophage regulatory protein